MPFKFEVDIEAVKASFNDIRFDNVTSESEDFTVYKYTAFA